MKVPSEHGPVLLVETVCRASPDGEIELRLVELAIGEDFSGCVVLAFCKVMLLVMPLLVLARDALFLGATIACPSGTIDVVQI